MKNRSAWEDTVLPFTKWKHNMDNHRWQHDGGVMRPNANGCVVRNAEKKKKREKLRSVRNEAETS